MFTFYILAINSSFRYLTFSFSVVQKKEWNVSRLKGNFSLFFFLLLSATPSTSTLCMHTMSSASNASFLTSKWKVPSFFLFLPRWHPLSPFRHHQKAEQDAENLKNGPLWAARGSADTIKEWYRLQIMHVSGLILILSERKRDSAEMYRCTAETLHAE